MKTGFAVLAAAALLLSTGIAHATSIGLISTTQSGVVLPNDVVNVYSNNNNTQPITQIDESYTGTLAAHTSITFDFSVTTGVLGIYGETLTGTGSYNASVGNTYYNGQSSANLTGSSPSTSPYNASGGIQKSGSYTSDALVIATAVIVSGQNAYVTITNNSPVVADFLARLQTQLAGLATAQSFKTTYSSVSAVPLPGTFSLFVLGLAAFAFIAARRKKLGARF